MKRSKNFAARMVRRLPMVGIAALLAQSARAQFVYDLSQPSPAPLGSAIINGGYLFSITPTTASGTGVYNTFSGFQNSGSEEGYNATARPVMPNEETSSQRVFDVQLNTLPTIAISGITYYTLGLDINEGGGANSFVSLDQLKVYVRQTAITTADTLASLSGSSTLAWDMDAGVKGNSVVLLNQAISSSGSGRSDVTFLVPKATVDAASGVAGANAYFYLYAQLGAYGGNYTSEGGFEEWQMVSGLTYTPPAPIPEAGTVSAGIAIAGASVGLLAWRRRRSAAAKA